MRARLNQNRKLHRRFRPAIYFDSSVLINYWLANEMRPSEDPVLADLYSKNEPPHYRIVKKLIETFKPYSHFGKLRTLRDRLTMGGGKGSVVASPIALLELYKWIAESNFRFILMELGGATFLKGKSEKDIAALLSESIKQCGQEEIKGKTEGRRKSSATDLLLADTLAATSYAETHGLEGIYLVDIAGFNLNINDTLEEDIVYSYLQLSASDIVHLLLARHIGCEYFASFDSDFKRVREGIKSQYGMTLLTSSDEILRALK